MNDVAAHVRVERARVAHLDWARVSVKQRARRLRLLRQTLAARMDEAVRTVCEEIGKPPLDALTGDVMVTLELLRYYESSAKTILRPRKMGSGPFLYFGTAFKESYEPYGVALVFAPWNYPLQLSLAPAATALFAGNAVILKCSERAPRTAAFIESVYHQAGLPQNLLQVTCDPPETASQLIDSQPDIVFFTGSSTNGRAVGQHAANHLIPTVLELGGKDAALVFADCDLDRTVEGVLYGAFANAGQVCVGTKRIYVENSIYDDFLGRFATAASGLRSGRGEGFDMGPILFNETRSRLRKQVDDAIRRGAKLHTQWDDSTSGATAVVLSQVPPDALLLAEESFGPVVCVVAFRDESEVVQLANSSCFALNCSIWTGDRKRAQRVASQVSSGSCSINDVIRNIGNPGTAFGGNRSSGHGRYHGAEGLYAFSTKKTVMTTVRMRKRERHWFPLRSSTYRLIRKLMLFRHAKGTFIRRIRHLFKPSRIPLLLFAMTAIVQAGSGLHLYLDGSFNRPKNGTVPLRDEGCRFSIGAADRTISTLLAPRQRYE